MSHPTSALAPSTTGRTADLAAMSYLARYSGGTREHYRIVLSLLFRWLDHHGIDPLDATRPILEMFGRHLEEDRGSSPATVAGYLSVVKGYYKFADIDGHIAKNPAAHIRVPRVYIDESSQVGLDRHEFGALLAAAKASHVHEWALITLLGMLGLRISEALAVKIEDFQDHERGHRVLRLVGKGGKPATIPLPVVVQRAMDAAAGDRTAGPLLLRPANGQPMNRRSAAIALTKLCRRSGITKNVTPHSLRHTYVTSALDAGVPLRDVQRGARHSDPRITARYDRARNNHDRHANHTLAAYMASAA